MKKYTKKEIKVMIDKIKENNITIEEVNIQNKVFLVRHKTLIGNIHFTDFEIDLDIFKINIECLFPVQKNKITFNIEDLKKAILKPSCTCNGFITCNYDGEYTENYYFTCENCGAKEVLNGYELDCLVE